ncbi:hypothetical protein [Streptomyces celluloflavus]|uniref:hypothetical protein n=1 Tax=Streptomyces celluloflavus TaxID=58344 RepID=UPI0036C77127
MMTPNVRKGLAVVAALALFGGGVGLGLTASGDGDALAGGQSTGAPADNSGPGKGGTAGSSSAPAMGAARLSGGIPVGYPHTQAGAQSAAANYTAALNSPQLLTSAGREATVRAISAASSAGSLRSQLDGVDKTPSLDGLRSDKAAQNAFVMRTIPLSVTVSPGGYTAEKADVDVYAISFTVSSVSTAASTYGKSTVSLVWSDDDWKLAKYTVTPTIGPASNGYYAPSNGWQPQNGKSLYDVSAEFRKALGEGTVPGYVVP